jgi:hypothetical protein
MRTDGHVISQVNPAGIRVAGVAVSFGTAGHPPDSVGAAMTSTIGTSEHDRP